MENHMSIGIEHSSTNHWQTLVAHPVGYPRTSWQEHCLYHAQKQGRNLSSAQDY